MHIVSIETEGLLWNSICDTSALNNKRADWQKFYHGATEVMSHTK
jgi:hypothetical protein